MAEYNAFVAGCGSRGAAEAGHCADLTPGGHWPLTLTLPAVSRRAGSRPPAGQWGQKQAGRPSPAASAGNMASRATPASLSQPRADRKSRPAQTGQGRGQVQASAEADAEVTAGSGPEVSEWTGVGSREGRERRAAEAGRGGQRLGDAAGESERKATDTDLKRTAKRATRSELRAFMPGSGSSPTALPLALPGTGPGPGRTRRRAAPSGAALGSPLPAGHEPLAVRPRLASG